MPPAGGSFFYAATNLGFVQSLQDYFQGRRGQQSRHGVSLPLFPITVFAGEGAYRSGIGLG
jgi:hypothetical protein